MKRSQLFGLLVLVSIFCGSVSLAQQKLGKVNFPISCNAAAQAEFNRAVALLHSFYYTEMRKSFDAVIQKDSSCVMAYWGIAMGLLDNPLAAPPSAAALKEASAVIEKANALGAKSQREKDYIAAIETMYKDPDKRDVRTRALAYEKEMAELSQRYPEDKEAAIFYALAINITALPTDKTYSNQLKAAAILEKVFAEQPEHPGVAHYLIHSYDYPPIADKGLNAARRYAAIAPAAPHALHMPSHIFTRIGSWQESVDSNRDSRAVADARGKLHASDYMVYAYLQMGQDVEAKGILDEISAMQKVAAIQSTAYAFAAIPARYVIERRRWDEAAALTPYPSPSDFAWERFPMAEAVTLLARGLGAAHGGKIDEAKQISERLEILRERLTQAKNGYWAEQVEIQRQVVAAWTARAEKKDTDALKLMVAAADLEDKTEKHIVSPGPIVPARELLGEMLLEMNRPIEALQAFETSEKHDPNRFHGLCGAAKAAALAGDQSKAKNYFQRLLTLTKSPDTERPEIAEARAFLASK